METKWLARVIGLVIALASIGAAVLLWITVGLDQSVGALDNPVEQGLLLSWEFL